MTEPTGFLYPFLEAAETDEDGLMEALTRSAEAKWLQSESLRRSTLEQLSPALDRAATAVASRLEAGGRLFTLGNGGSAADADSTAGLFSRPPWGHPFGARSLAADIGIITALGNDVGIDVVFARQVIAYAAQGDVVLALSTSGSSENLIVALAEAQRRGALAVGIAGYDGGRMATADLDHCLVVNSDSIHRIQEVQGAVVHELWSRVQTLVGAAA